MSALPRPEPGAPALRLVASPEKRGGRGVARASAWTLGSMAVMSLLRLVSQALLTHLCLPEHFGLVTKMRIFLTFVEMVSDMGIRNAVIAHPRGEERGFLGTAFSVQALRGLTMWGLSCAIAWPVAAFYEAPLLLFLLPLAGLESVNNGLVSVRMYVAERRLKLAVPVLLEVLALLVSITTSVLWAWYDPTPWALALGPLVGGFVRMLVSHAWYRSEAVPMAWERQTARELFGYSRWILGSTMVSFVAQQFHLLYLGKFLADAVFGVYGVAWSLCAQASKPLTALANRVLVPHLAEAHRQTPVELQRAVAASARRFLPACLLVCLGAGLVAQAMFLLFYDASYEAGGWMGQLFAIVVWFMILQQVPRCALLAVNDSRAIAGMALWNAVLTVMGIVGGFALQGGWLAGGILGNALGNLAGCWVGWRAMRAHELRLGRTMTGFSLGFLALLGAGVELSRGLPTWTSIAPSTASLLASVLCCGPLAAWVLRDTVAPPRRAHGGA
jgi:O-antigen/teichoic acid export membrane protein